MKQSIRTAVATLIAVGLAAGAGAHCQIPCGIFDDELRVQLIEEHIGTVEKSMRQIQALSAAESIDHNQLVRWVMNKEHHAEEIQEIVTAYFMAQRVKLPAKGDDDAHKLYMHRLALLHHIQVAAMKAKQSTDLEAVTTLREYTGKFRKAYFGDQGGHAH
jgi:nickel superoxide dismutase